VNGEELERRQSSGPLHFAGILASTRVDETSTVPTTAEKGLPPTILHAVALEARQGSTRPEQLEISISSGHAFESPPSRWLDGATSECGDRQRRSA
jgi:tripartite-type tricarboxylate transporter receptor subunit TctC